MNYWIEGLRPGDVQLRLGFLKSLTFQQRAVCVYLKEHPGDEIVAPVIGATDLEPTRSVQTGEIFPGFFQSETVRRIHKETENLWDQCVYQSGRPRSVFNGRTHDCTSVIIDNGFHAMMQDAIFSDGGGWETNDQLRHLKRDTMIRVMMDNHLLEFMLTYRHARQQYLRQPIAA